MVWIKRGISLLLFAILVYLFMPLLKELRGMGALLRQADWAWLVAAVLIQVVSYLSLAEANRLLLHPFPGRIRLGRMMGVLPALAFIEVTVPSAGASGIVLRARLLGKSGYSLEASTFTVAIESLFIGGFMLLAALLGLAYMLRSGEIRIYQILLLALLTMMLVVAGVIAIWYGRDQEQVKSMALRLNAAANRWRKKYRRDCVADEAVVVRVEGFYSGLRQLDSRITGLSLLTSFGRVSLDIASLGACFLAFNYRISAGALLTGYGLMLLVSGLAALPGGLGMADLSLPVIYARLGAPGAVAVAAALAYRLIAWWLLRFIGFITWQILESKKNEN